MEDNFSDKKKWTSEYNEAVLQIQRLHHIWATSGNYSQQGELIKWKWALDRAWVELSTDARELDKEKVWALYEDKPYNEIPQEYRNSYLAQMKKINFLISMAKNAQSLYKVLSKKEMFLRYLQEKTGKGSKKKQTYDEDDWG